MRRLVAVTLVAVGLTVLPHHARAETIDERITPPAEGVPGSTTDHVYQRDLGGCGFAIGARPVGDDLVMGGTCRRAPAASPPSAPGKPAAAGGTTGPGGAPAAPIPPPPPDPADIAYDLTFGLPWASPTPETAPGWRNGHTITGVRTWLWVDGLKPLTATAAVRGLRVAVTAKPASTRWNLTEEVVDCDGLGRAYVNGAEPTCSHAFRYRSTDRGGDGRYPALVTVFWDVSWRSSDGRTGRLGQVTTAARFRMAVTGAEAVTD